MKWIESKKKWIGLSCGVILLLACAQWMGIGKTRASANSFRFVVMGDTRGNSDSVNEKTLRSLLKNVKKRDPQPSFLLITGDMVQGGSDLDKELDEWKDIVDDYYPLSMYYPAMGNHEDDPEAFGKAFPHLPNEQVPGYGRTAYSFDYGNARFITLNTDHEDQDGNYVIDQPQSTWLKQQLSAPGKDHTFVMFHVPAYPVGGHYGRSLDGNKPERDAFWHTLDAANVTAAFVGHEHNYNRRLINSDFDANGYHFTHDIYQLTLGAAGSPYSKVVEDKKNVVKGPKVTSHYMTVDVDGKKAVCNVYDKDDNLLDSFTVDKGAIGVAG